MPLSGWLTGRSLIAVSTLLQLIWLSLIWATAATAAVHKLLLLAILTVVLAIIFQLVPDRIWTLLFSRQKTVLGYESHLLIGGALLVFSLLVIFAYQQRVWTFDETSNLQASRIVAEGGVVALLESYEQISWLSRHHPPLVPIMVGTAMRVAGTSLTAGRIISVLFTLGTGLVTYLIAKHLCGRRIALASTLILFSFPLVFRLGAAAMPEMPLTFFFSLAVLITLKVAERPGAWRLLVLGVVFGSGLLSKYTMVFVLPLILAIVALRGSWKWALLALLLLTTGGIIAIAGLLILFDRPSIIHEQVLTISQYLGSPLQSELVGRFFLETIVTRLPSALGAYNLPLVALGGLLLARRGRSSDWVIVLWILSVWVPVLLTIPDHRYFLSSFPAVAILVALGLEQIPNVTGRVVLFTLLLATSTSYLYVDWVRTTHLFLDKQSKVVYSLGDSAP